MTEVTNAWRVPAFRRIWGAGAFSALGAEIGELAIPVLAVVTLGASASELSFVRAALLTPYLVLTLALGVLVDRVRRRPLMIGADLGRGLLLVAVCALALSGRLTVPMLVVAAALVGSLTVLYALADFSFLPLVVDDSALIDANARITATQSVIGVAGSGAGGLLVQALTAPVAIALNAIGYLLSGALLARVRVPEPRRPRAERVSALAELRVGMAALMQHRVLRALVAEAGMWNFGNEILMISLTILLLQSFGWGPVVLGAVLMAVGVGAVVGSVLSQRLTLRFGYGRSLVVALLVGNTAPLAGVLGIRTPSWLALSRPRRGLRAVRCRDRGRQLPDRQPAPARRRPGAPRSRQRHLPPRVVGQPVDRRARRRGPRDQLRTVAGGRDRCHPDGAREPARRRLSRQAHAPDRGGRPGASGGDRARVLSDRSRRHRSRKGAVPEQRVSCRGICD